jgi:hypothetical protein
MLFAFVVNTMSNKVWVTWKNAAGEAPFCKVREFEDGAIVDDLRKKFVKQQNLITTIPSTLSVFETEGGEKLKAGKRS